MNVKTSFFALVAFLSCNTSKVQAISFDYIDHGTCHDAQSREFDFLKWDDTLNCDQCNSKCSTYNNAVGMYCYNGTRFGISCSCYFNNGELPGKGDADMRYDRASGVAPITHTEGIKNPDAYCYALATPSPTKSPVPPVPTASPTQAPSFSPTISPTPAPSSSPTTSPTTVLQYCQTISDRKTCNGENWCAFDPYEESCKSYNLVHQTCIEKVERSTCNDYKKLCKFRSGICTPKVKSPVTNQPTTSPTPPTSTPTIAPTMDACRSFWANTKHCAQFTENEKACNNQKGTNNERRCDFLARSKVCSSFTRKPDDCMPLPTVSPTVSPSTSPTVPTTPVPTDSPSKSPTQSPTTFCASFTKKRTCKKSNDCVWVDHNQSCVEKTEAPTHSPTPCLDLTSHLNQNQRVWIATHCLELSTQTCHTESNGLCAIVFNACTLCGYGGP